MNARRRRTLKPPPVLDGCRVLEYAIRDPSIRFRGPSSLFVNGEPVGAVPRLAIVRDLKTNELLLLHCRKSWTSIAVAGYETRGALQAAAERIYPGISRKWIRAGVSKARAEAFVRKMYKGRECSFCNRRPDQIDSMIVSRRARICDICIREFGWIKPSS